MRSCLMKNDIFNTWILLMIFLHTMMISWWHLGDTYAFMSDNGFYPKLNASISVVVNQVNVH